MIVSRLAVSAVLAFVVYGAMAAEMGKVPTTPAMQKPQPSPAAMSFCNKVSLSAPAGATNDGEHDVGSMPTPKGTLVYRGVVAKSKITDAWPTLQGRRLAEQAGVPKAVTDCVAQRGEKLADASSNVLDLIVPAANAKWCGSPRSYTACTKSICATCVWSGTTKCGCYHF